MTNDKEKNRAGSAHSCNRFGGNTTLTKQGAAKTFYSSACPAEGSLGRKEMQRKRGMDPMKDFHNDDAQESVEDIDHKQTFHARKINSSEESLDRSKTKNRKRTRKRRETRSYVCSSSCDDELSKRAKEKPRGKKKRRYGKDNHARSRRKRSRSQESHQIYYNSVESDASNSSMKELRKKRAEREKRERQRQDAFLHQATNFR